jgi:NADH:ubiquinone oxidoreductase subunit 4 (subunit M)
MAPAISRRSGSVRRGAGRLRFFLLTTLGSLLMLAIVVAPALGAEKVPTWEISKEKAPALDYTLSAGTAVLTFGLLIGFFVMLFWLSEREFKGVINERFGPKK